MRKALKALLLIPALACAGVAGWHLSLAYANGEIPGVPARPEAAVSRYDVILVAFPRMGGGHAPEEAVYVVADHLVRIIPEAAAKTYAAAGVLEGSVVPLDPHWREWDAPSSGSDDILSVVHRATGRVFPNGTLMRGKFLFAR